MLRLGRVLGLALSFLAATGALAAAPQAALDGFAQNLGYRLTIVSNKTARECSQTEACFSATLDLTMPRTMPTGDWSLHLSFTDSARLAENAAFTLAEGNGSFHRLVPKAGAVKAGATYRLNLYGRSSFMSPFFLLPNVYVVQPGLTPRIIAATRPKNDPGSRLEELPFIAPFTDEAQLGTSNPNDLTTWLTPARLFEQTAQRQRDVAAPEFIILPTPTKAVHLDGPAINLKGGVTLALRGIRSADIAPALAALGRSVPIGKSGVMLTIATDAGMGSESYRLAARNGAITIIAADAAGASYGLRSLAQQAAYEKLRLKPQEIEDAPRFTYRGVMLDIARNFRPKAHILAVMEQMAAVKLNKLHMHMGDDEGWRLQIAGLPDLTGVGARRCHDPAETRCQMPFLAADPNSAAPGSGHLTRADYIEIVKAAKARQIEVIPSFDMPGHSRAAILAMKARALRLIAAGQPEEAARYRLDEPEDKTVYDSVQHYNDNTLNVCMPSTYAFIGKVIDDVKAMHQAAGARLRVYHIGADETAGAWKESPTCRTFMAEQKLKLEDLGHHFLERVGAILRARDIVPGGWSDGLSELNPAQMPPKVMSYAWGNLFGVGVPEAHRHANQGWDVVLSMPQTLYFDMPHAADGWERGTTWATRTLDLYQVFSFLPENLGANAAIRTNGQNRPVTMADSTPLAAGRQVIGMQAQLWSEVVRSPAIADYMLFPRIQALAERAWHAAAWEPAYVAGKTYAFGDNAVDPAALLNDWNIFQAKLVPQLAAMDRAAIRYRLPVPGARITGGMLEANVPVTGLRIQYRTGTAAWRSYTGPVAVSGKTELRTLSPDGKRGSRPIAVN
jgi:hexosaminidase